MPKIQLILITLAALALVSAVACGESKEDKFRESMWQWLVQNVGDDAAWQGDFERMSDDEVLALVKDLNEIPSAGTKYDKDKSILIRNLETLALANDRVEWSKEYTKLDWLEKAEAAGKDYIQMPDCPSRGVTPGIREVDRLTRLYGDKIDYAYDVIPALSTACEFQDHELRNLERNIGDWNQIFGCPSQFFPCYEGSLRD